mmetsp:Transcript_13908/g.27023  ORF Transcript_13908/g.27023 Transcript_13908/m.27023 type:complete len:300 (+) Transcript_13908:305-1204(+)
MARASPSMQKVCKYLVLSFAVAVCSPSTASGQKVLLEKVSALTFRKGMMTTGRRSSPVPQLACVGGDCSFQPDIVQCRNVGTDSYGEVQWECTAQLPAEFDLGETDVVCEGYNSRDDPYILAGSCGLEYTMRSRGGGRGRFSSFGSYPSTSYKKSGGWVSTFVNLIMVGSIGMLIYQLFVKPNDSRQSSSRRNNTGGGNGGGWWPGGGGGGGWGSGGYDGYYGQSCDTRTRGTNNGPGFWTGLGLGAIGASMFRGNGGYQRRNYWGDQYDRGYTRDRDYGNDAGSGGHTSRGFGGTRRR